MNTLFVFIIIFLFIMALSFHLNLAHLELKFDIYLTRLVKMFFYLLQVIENFINLL